MSKFVSVKRCIEKESWSEVFDIESIICIEEYRVGKQIYSNKCGKRHGYIVRLKGNHSIWINDVEYAKILNIINSNNAIINL